MTGYISAFTLPTIYYLVAKSLNHVSALAAIDRCLAAFEVVPVDRGCITTARQLGGKDFEDDLQLACALTSSLDCIISRDLTHFPGTHLAAYTPADFVRNVLTT